MQYEITASFGMELYLSCHIGKGAIQPWKRLFGLHSDGFCLSIGCMEVHTGTRNKALGRPHIRKVRRVVLFEGKLKREK